MLNLTPHDIIILDEAGETVLAVIPPSGQVARVAVKRERVGTMIRWDNRQIPVYRDTTGEVEGLPEENGEIKIVSTLVRLACPERRDLFSPGELVRDEAGQPIGCKGLVR